MIIVPLIWYICGEFYLKHVSGKGWGTPDPEVPGLELRLCGILGKVTMYNHSEGARPS